MTAATGGKQVLVLVESRRRRFTAAVLRHREIETILLRTTTDGPPAEGVTTFHLDMGRSPIQEATRFRDWARRVGLTPGHFCNHDENVQSYVHLFAAAAGLPAMTAPQVRAVTDKLAMKEVFEAAGLPCARYKPITGVDTVEKFGANVGWPVVVKPVRSGSSADVWKIDEHDGNRLRGLLTEEITRRRWIVEEFVDGTEYQLCALVHQGTVLDAYVARNPVPVLEALDGGMNGDITLAPSEAKPIDAVAVCQRVVDVLGYDSGSLHAEFFVGTDGRLVMGEMGARLGGAELPTNHSLAYGFDMLSAVADLYIGRRPELRYSDDRSVGCLLLPVRKGHVSHVSSISDLMGLPGVLAGEVNVKSGDHLDPPRKSSSCSGFVHIEGADSAQVQERMTRALDAFRLETTPV